MTPLPTSDGLDKELSLPSSGKAGFAQADIPSESALRRANDLLEDIGGDPEKLGASDVVDGWWIETHTLGCRSHADEDGEDAWNTHYDLFKEYAYDGISCVFGGAEDGYFVTLTPQRTEN